MDTKPEDEAQERPDSLRPPGDISYARGDVQRRDDLARILDVSPPVDVAIGNAGIGSSSPFLDMTGEQWNSFAMDDA